MNCGKNIDCRTCFAELGDDVEKCEYWQEKKVMDAEARMELYKDMESESRTERK